MKSKIHGVVISIFPDDINTDDIVPAWTLQESTERSFFKNYAFHNYDPDFVKQCEKNKTNIIVAGENFGCGSSREQAVYALQENNVVAVVAKSYPDIFYRNALNNGLVLVNIDDISPFQSGANVEIDLKEKIVTINGKNKIKFQISDEEATTFAYGGKIGKVRAHLAELLGKQSQNGYTPSEYVDKTIKVQKPQTIVEKIIGDHMGKAVHAGEKISRLPIDVLFFNEVIAPPAIKDFQVFFRDIYNKYGKEPKIFDPRYIFMIPDHTVPSSSVAVSEGITLMENFAKRQGLRCYKEGDGIEHVVLIEDGYIAPGEIVLGTDSHTDTNGALNTLALGVGTTDAAFALATGCLYDFEIPRTIRINLKGNFNKGVYGKDLILYLIGKLGVAGAVRRVIEFGGSALGNLSMDARTTIANMAVEMGARTAIFEYDSTLESFLKNRAKFPYKPYMPDDKCEYDRVIELDLCELEPMVAFPHKPEYATPVSNIKSYMKKLQLLRKPDLADVASLKITDAFLGACTNGRYEDFVAAAKILRDRTIHPDVNFVVIPASRKVYNQLMKEGVLRVFADAGANVESSNCGPCFGKHMGVIGKDAQMISSSNRNYIGRMGSQKANIFLASPVTVTAAAVAGEIVDPRKFM